MPLDNINDPWRNEEEQPEIQAAPPPAPPQQQPEPEQNAPAEEQAEAQPTEQEGQAEPSSGGEWSLPYSREEAEQIVGSVSTDDFKPNATTPEPPKWTPENDPYESKLTGIYDERNVDYGMGHDDEVRQRAKQIDQLKSQIRFAREHGQDVTTEEWGDDQQIDEILAGSNIRHNFTPEVNEMLDRFTENVSQKYQAAKDEMGRLEGVLNTAKNTLDPNAIVDGWAESAKVLGWMAGGVGDEDFTDYLLDKMDKDELARMRDPGKVEGFKDIHDGLDAIALVGNVFAEQSSIIAESMLVAAASAATAGAAGAAWGSARAATKAATEAGVKVAMKKMAKKVAAQEAKRLAEREVATQLGRASVKAGGSFIVRTQGFFAAGGQTARTAAENAVAKKAGEGVAKSMARREGAKAAKEAAEAAAKNEARKKSARNLGAMVVDYQFNLASSAEQRMGEAQRRGPTEIGRGAVFGQAAGRTVADYFGPIRKLATGGFRPGTTLQQMARDGVLTSARTFRGGLIAAGGRFSREGLGAGTSFVGETFSDRITNYAVNNTFLINDETDWTDAVANDLETFVKGGIMSLTGAPGLAKRAMAEVQLNRAVDAFADTKGAAFDNAFAKSRRMRDTFASPGFAKLDLASQRSILEMNRLRAKLDQANMLQRSARNEQEANAAASEATILSQQISQMRDTLSPDGAKWIDAYNSCFSNQNTSMAEFDNDVNNNSETAAKLAGEFAPDAPQVGVISDAISEMCGGEVSYENIYDTITDNKDGILIDSGNVCLRIDEEENANGERTGKLVISITRTDGGPMADNFISEFRVEDFALDGEGMDHPNTIHRALEAAVGAERKLSSWAKWADAKEYGPSLDFANRIAEKSGRKVIIVRNSQDLLNAGLQIDENGKLRGKEQVFDSNYPNGLSHNWLGFTEPDGTIYVRADAYNSAAELAAIVDHESFHSRLVEMVAKMQEGEEGKKLAAEFEKKTGQQLTPDNLRRVLRAQILGIDLTADNYAGLDAETIDQDLEKQEEKYAWDTMGMVPREQRVTLLQKIFKNVPILKRCLSTYMFEDLGKAPENQEEMANYLFAIMAKTENKNGTAFLGVQPLEAKAKEMQAREKQEQKQQTDRGEEEGGESAAPAETGPEDGGGGEGAAPERTLPAPNSGPSVMATEQTYRALGELLTQAVKDGVFKSKNKAIVEQVKAFLQGAGVAIDEAKVEDGTYSIKVDQGAAVNAIMNNLAWRSDDGGNGAVNAILAFADSIGVDVLMDEDGNITGVVDQNTTTAETEETKEPAPEQEQAPTPEPAPEPAPTPEPKPEPVKEPEPAPAPEPKKLEPEPPKKTLKRAPAEQKKGETAEKKTLKKKPEAAAPAPATTPAPAPAPTQPANVPQPVEGAKGKKSLKKPNAETSTQKGVNRLEAAVKKFNDARKAALDRIGDDGSLFMDSGSTIQSLPEYVSDMRVEVGKDAVIVSWEEESASGWGKPKRVTNTERAPIEEDGTVDVDNVLDAIKYKLKGVSRAVKYYEQVTPENEERVLERLSGEIGEEAGEAEETEPAPAPTPSNSSNAEKPVEGAKEEKKTHRRRSVATAKQEVARAEAKRDLRGESKAGVATAFQQRNAARTARDRALEGKVAARGVKDAKGKNVRSDAKQGAVSERAEEIAQQSIQIAGLNNATGTDAVLDAARNAIINAEYSSAGPNDKLGAIARIAYETRQRDAAAADALVNNGLPRKPNDLNPITPDEAVAAKPDTIDDLILQSLSPDGPFDTLQEALRIMDSDAAAEAHGPAAVDAVLRAIEPLLDLPVDEVPPAIAERAAALQDRMDRLVLGKAAGSSEKQQAKVQAVRDALAAQHQVKDFTSNLIGNERALQELNDELNRRNEKSISADEKIDNRSKSAFDDGSIVDEEGHDWGNIDTDLYNDFSSQDEKDEYGTGGAFASEESLRKAEKAGLSSRNMVQSRQRRTTTNGIQRPEEGRTQEIASGAKALAGRDAGAAADVAARSVSNGGRIGIAVRIASSLARAEREGGGLAGNGNVQAGVRGPTGVSQAARGELGRNLERLVRQEAVVNRCWAMRGIEDALRANPRLEETTLSGSETTTIFMDKKAQTVWKVTRASYADPTSFWYKTALFNATFGQDTGVSVLGYGLNEMGEFSIIGLQRLVDIDKAATNKLTPQRIFTYLKTVFGPNLQKTGDYAFETPLVTIRDAGPGNVVVDKQGRIRVIDIDIDPKPALKDAMTERFVREQSSFASDESLRAASRPSGVQKSADVNYPDAGAEIASAQSTFAPRFASDDSLRAAEGGLTGSALSDPNIVALALGAVRVHNPDGSVSYSTNVTDLIRAEQFLNEDPKFAPWTGRQNLRAVFAEAGNVLRKDPAAAERIKEKVLDAYKKYQAGDKNAAARLSVSAHDVQVLRAMLVTRNQALVAANDAVENAENNGADNLNDLRVAELNAEAQYYDALMACGFAERAIGTALGSIARLMENDFSMGGILKRLGEVDGGVTAEDAKKMRGVSREGEAAQKKHDDAVKAIEEEERKKLVARKVDDAVGEGRRNKAAGRKAKTVAEAVEAARKELADGEMVDISVYPELWAQIGDAVKGIARAIIGEHLEGPSRLKALDHAEFARRLLAETNKAYEGRIVSRDMENHKELTERDVLDLFSDYGDPQKLQEGYGATDIGAGRLREAQSRLKKLSQMMSALDDIKAGKPPLEAYGHLRDLTPKQVDEEMERVKKEMDEAWRASGLDKNLLHRAMSPVEIVREGIEKRIAEIKANLAAGELAKKQGRKPIAGEEGLAGLREELKMLQSIQDSVFKNRGLTDEQRLAAIEENYRRTEASAMATLQRLMAGGRPVKPLDMSDDGARSAWATAERAWRQKIGEARRAAADATRRLNELRQRMTPESYRGEKALERAIARREDMAARWEEAVNAGRVTLGGRGIMRDPKMRFDPRLVEADRALRDVIAKRDRLIAEIKYDHAKGWEKLKMNLSAIPNTMRQMLASGDNSGIGVQCAVATLANPKDGIKAVFPGIKVFWNTLFGDGMATERYMESIYRDPDFERIAAYVEIPRTDGKGNFTQNSTEEFFQHGVVADRLQKILHVPLFDNKYMRASEAGFNVPVAMIRFELAKRLLAHLRDMKGEGYTPTNEEMSLLGKVVNAATGRGKFFSGGGPVDLSNVFWAAGRVSGQVESLFLPARLFLKHGEVDLAFRKKIARELIWKPWRNFAAAALLFGLAHAIFKDEDDDDPFMELDPTSSKFLRMKVGTRYFDITSGMPSYITLAAKGIWGEKKTVGGKRVALRGQGAFGQSWSNDLWRFFRNKLLPGYGIIISLFDGRNAIGEEIEPTALGVSKFLAVNGFLPLTAKDIVDSIEDFDRNGPLFTASLAFLANLGYTTSNFGQTPYKNDRAAIETIDEVRKQAEAGVDGMDDAWSDIALNEDNARYIKAASDKQMVALAKRIADINGLIRNGETTKDRKSGRVVSRRKLTREERRAAEREKDALEAEYHERLWPELRKLR